MMEDGGDKEDRKKEYIRQMWIIIETSFIGLFGVDK